MHQENDAAMIAVSVLFGAVYAYLAALHLAEWLECSSLNRMQLIMSRVWSSNGERARAEQRIHYSSSALARHAVLVSVEFLTLWPLAVVGDPARYWELGAMPALATLLYGCQAFFYACGLFCAVFDEDTPDRRRMIVHHVVTLGLISYSANAGLWRVGVAVMAACDACDVALHAGKLFKDVWRSERAATACFVLFVALWCVQRLYGVVWLVIVPYVATWAGAAPSVAWLGVVAVPPETGTHALLAALLAALGALFLAWTLEIARVIVRRVRAGELTDVRDTAQGTARSHAD